MRENGENDETMSLDEDVWGDEGSISVLDEEGIWETLPVTADNLISSGIVRVSTAKRSIIMKYIIILKYLQL